MQHLVYFTLDNMMRTTIMMMTMMATMMMMVMAMMTMVMMMMAIILDLKFLLSPRWAADEATG